MVKSRPSEIYYAPGPDGSPPEMDPPVYVRPAAEEEAPPAPECIQWCLVNGAWVGYPVACEPKPESKPEEFFQPYMPDWDGGPPCGGQVPVKAVPVESAFSDSSNAATCGTSCCCHWCCDAPPPPPVLKKEAAPPAPPPISPCSICSFSSCYSSIICSTCPSTPCSECAPEPEPEKIVVKIYRPNRADVPMGSKMEYLGRDAEMTTVNMISHGHKPWEKPGEEFDFVAYEIDSGITIRTLIKRLVIPAGHGVCETVEIGNGHWLQADSYVPVDRDAFVAQTRAAFAQLSEDVLKGLTLGEKCDQTLEKAGWEGKVVWLTLWK